MPDTDLSPVVPPNATWVKIRYTMEAQGPTTDLTTRLWSGTVDDAVTIKGASGEVFVKLHQPQRLSYDKPDGIKLKMKVVAYKTGTKNN